MARDDLLQQWLDKGNDDLRSAEYLSTMHYPTPDEVICNLCQQSAEKYLKGFLYFHDIQPPKIHDLKMLLKMCLKLNDNISILLTKVSVLTQYAVIPRYPNDLEITVSDMKTALCYVQDIKEFILETINKSSE